MKYSLVLPVIICLLFSCTHSNKQNASRHAATNKNKGGSSTPEAKSGNPAVEHFQYKLESDTFLQMLDCEWIGADKVKFHLTSKNKPLKKETSVSGVAHGNMSSGDPEMDEDEDGNVYPVTVYTYIKDNNKCSIDIRINTEDKSTAQTKTYHCEDVFPSDCPVASEGILKRQ